MGKLDIKLLLALDAIGRGGSGQVWIMPGTYTENLVSPNGINVTLYSAGDDHCGDVVIVGMHTPPDTGNLLTWKIGLHSSSHIYNSAAAGSCNILIGHNIQVCNGYIFNMPNWTSSGTFTLFATSDFGSTSDGVVNNTGGVTVFLLESSVGVGNSNPMILSGFSLIEVNNISCPIHFRIRSSINFYDSNFFAPITLGGATNGFFVNSYLSTGASAALTYNSSGNTILSNVVIASTNNPAIAGTSAGQLQIGSVTFMNNSAIAGTVTTTRASTLDTGIIAAGGNLNFLTAGNKITAPAATTTAAGAIAFGTVVLVGGTATVATTAVTANSIILLTAQVLGTVAVASGYAVTSRTAGTSFVITASAGTDTSTIGWQIIN